MAETRRVVMSTKAEERDRALVQLVAKEEGITVSELIWRLVVPIIRDRVLAQLQQR